MIFKAAKEGFVRLEELSAFKNLATSKKEAGKARDVEIAEGQMKQQAIRGFAKRVVEHLDGEVYKSRQAFHDDLKELAQEWRSPVRSADIKMLVTVLGERHEAGEICRDRNGNPKADSELRDTDTVPLKEDVREYFQREVLPHVPDA